MQEVTGSTPVFSTKGGSNGAAFHLRSKGKAGGFFTAPVENAVEKQGVIPGNPRALRATFGKLRGSRRLIEHDRQPEVQKRRTESNMKGEGEPGFRNTQNLLEDIVSVGK